MADRVVPGPVNDNDCIKQAVCVSTRKIMDACRDKDCIEDLRVYPTVSSLPYIESAFSVRPKCAQLLHCEVKVNEICLNRGYYTVDVTYFYKISGETFPANQCFTGLAVFDKRVMLFGSEGRVRSFSSDDSFGEEISVTGGTRHVYVTLGQFSIIRLERSTQLLIPAYDYCLPEKECVGSSEDDPCTMFGRISFPVDEFFPPDNLDPCEDYKSMV